MSAAPQAEKKGHVCPPSNATRPRDRWESMFIYSFICKFTQLRSKVEGLETPMDFENSLLSREPNHILSKILQQFILNLRPQTRNLSGDQISTTVASVLADYFKTSERTVFWDDELKANVDPFEGLQGGFFAADWDFKLKILRQLVELQLTHAPDIKGVIDRAWGVSQNKHKKKEDGTVPTDTIDTKSRESLQLVPLGQDSERKRYWIADDSPRIYVSTNPWKITATFQSVSSTRDEYIATIAILEDSAPPEFKFKNGEKKSKLELAHLALIKDLESRVGAIDAEIARVQKARRKIEQRALLLAQAEIRQTRTRRQTRRPDYVYTDAADSEEEGDEYKYQDDDEYDDEQFEQDDFLNFRTDRQNARRASTTIVQRRSSRATATAAAKRTSPDDDWGLWRGERRSTRLVSHPPRKRARTEESTMSASSGNVTQAAPIAPVVTENENNNSKAKVNGAAAVKPTEIAMEQVAGRKKSKFWFYAVEPIQGPPGSGSSVLPNGTALSGVNGHHNGNADTSGNGSYLSDAVQDSDVAMDFRRSLEGSLSPALSVES